MLGEFPRVIVKVKEHNRGLADWFARAVALTVLETGEYRQFVDMLSHIEMNETRNSTLLEGASWLRNRDDLVGLQVIVASIPAGWVRDRVLLDEAAALGRSACKFSVGMESLNQIVGSESSSTGGCRCRSICKETVVLYGRERITQYCQVAEVIVARATSEGGTKLTSAIRDLAAEMYRLGRISNAEKLLSDCDESDEAQIVTEFACADAAAGRWESAFARFKAEGTKRNDFGGIPLLRDQRHERTPRAGTVRRRNEFCGCS